MAAKRKVSAEDREEYKKMFVLFDEDKSGAIDQEELGAAMRSLGVNPTGAEIREMMTEFDADGNGTIEFDEFVTMMVKIQESDPTSDQQLRVAFNNVDLNRDGQISASELKFAMAKLGEELSDEEVSKMILEADMDGDGKINFKEFSRMMGGR